MNNLIGQRIQSARFDFNKATGEFIAEMSELGFAGLDPTGRLYGDAGDQGFVMISAKSGKEVVFVLTEEARDADHDIKFWSFAPAPQDLAFNPELRGLRVTVLND